MSEPSPAAYPARTHYQRAEVYSTYDERRFSSWYGRWVHRLEARALVRALHELPPGARVLELATGTGRMTREAVRAGFTVIGSDISRGMLGYAGTRLSGEGRLGGLLRAAAERMPVRDGAVDAVMTYRFLHHLDHEARARVFRETHRVARRFAVLQFSTPRSLWFLARRARERRRHRPLRIGLTPREFAQELADAGFRERRTYFALPFLAETYVSVFERVEASAPATGGPASASLP